MKELLTKVSDYDRLLKLSLKKQNKIGYKILCFWSKTVEEQILSNVLNKKLLTNLKIRDKINELLLRKQNSKSSLKIED